MQGVVLDRLSPQLWCIERRDIARNQGSLSGFTSRPMDKEMRVVTRAAVADLFVLFLGHNQHDMGPRRLRILLTRIDCQP